MDPEPLATASIAQVHVADLDGQRVAIKVQRPGIEQQFRSDVRMMMVLLGLVRLLRVRPLYWLDEPIREFAGWTDEELDFRREARHLSLVRRQSIGRKGVRMPEVIMGLTTRRVLVTEYLDGVPMATYMRARETQDASWHAMDARLRSLGFDPGVFGRQIIFNFTHDSFYHGLFHADLHPANLLILPGNVVGYVDFGITGAIGPYARTWLAAMTLALVRRDIDDLHRSFLKLVVPRRDANPVAFRVGLDKLADSWYGGSGGTRLRRAGSAGDDRDAGAIARDGDASRAGGGEVHPIGHDPRRRRPPLRTGPRPRPRNRAGVDRDAECAVGPPAGVCGLGRRLTRA